MLFFSDFNKSLQLQKDVQYIIYFIIYTRSIYNRSLTLHSQPKMIFPNDLNMDFNLQGGQGHKLLSSLVIRIKKLLTKEFL